MELPRFRLFVLFAVAVIALAAPWALSKLVPVFLPLGRTVAAASIYLLALAPAVLIWWAVRRGPSVPHPQSALPAKARTLGFTDLAWAASLVLVGVTVITVIGQIATFGNSVSEPSTPTPLHYRIVVLLGSSVVTALREEIQYRYVMYRFLRPDLKPGLTIGQRLLGVGPALIGSSLFFAAGHYMVVDSAMTMLNTAWVGLVLALCYELSGKFWVPVMIHFLNNFAANSVLFEDRIAIGAVVTACLVAVALVGGISTAQQSPIHRVS